MRIKNALSPLSVLFFSLLRDTPLPFIEENAAPHRVPRTFRRARGQMLTNLDQADHL